MSHLSFSLIWTRKQWCLCFADCSRWLEATDRNCMRGCSLNGYHDLEHRRSTPSTLLLTVAFRAQPPPGTYETLSKDTEAESLDCFGRAGLVLFMKAVGRVKLRVA